VRAVFLPGERRVELREVPVPEPGAGQVLVRVEASGICGSDLRAIYRPRIQGSGPEAYRGVIAGHEPAGRVEATGPGVTRFAAGDRAAVYHIAGCGLCSDCQAGWMISCRSPLRAAYGWQRDGGHAPFLLAEERTLVRLPDEVSVEAGALAACGLGTAYAAITRLGVSAQDRVLVTGLGPVGLGTALLCAALGARVVGVEANAGRRDVACRLGIDAIEPGPDAAAALVERSGGAGFEVAIDCAGNADARLLCLQAARDWGRVAFVGEGGDVRFEVSPLVIHRQLTIIGSWVCSIGQMERLVELLARWRLQPEQMITHRFDIDQAAEAYAVADRGEGGKVVLAPNRAEPALGAGAAG
jgi:2-desacetyl-2-hydroxyethyl bacteriochlorophyllide A dehydrogenase